MSPEEIDETFEQCPRCGTYLVRLSLHECTGASHDEYSDPAREERRQRAAADRRDDDDPVLIMTTPKSGGAYAYHEPAADGRPLCSVNGHRDPDRWRTIPRATAKARGKSPCGHCARRSGSRTGRLDPDARPEHRP
jgi:hypothetical protein